MAIGAVVVEVQTEEELAIQVSETQRKSEMRIDLGSEALWLDSKKAAL